MSGERDVETIARAIATVEQGDPDEVFYPDGEPWWMQYREDAEAVLDALREQERNSWYSDDLVADAHTQRVALALYVHSTGYEPDGEGPLSKSWHDLTPHEKGPWLDSAHAALDAVRGLGYCSRDEIEQALQLPQAVSAALDTFGGDGYADRSGGEVRAAMALALRAALRCVLVGDEPS